MKTKQIRKIITTIGIIAFLLLTCYKCPFDYIIGLSCPGCGMTRAFISLAHLDIVKAFHFHPLFPIVILVALYFVLEHFKCLTFSDSTKHCFLWVICALFLLVYFVRLFSASEIVTFHFEDSILYKAIQFIKDTIT